LLGYVYGARVQPPPVIEVHRIPPDIRVPIPTPRIPRIRRPQPARIRTKESPRDIRVIPLPRVILRRRGRVPLVRRELPPAVRRRSPFFLPVRQVPVLLPVVQRPHRTQPVLHLPLRRIQ